METLSDMSKDISNYVTVLTFDLLCNDKKRRSTLLFFVKMISNKLKLGVFEMLVMEISSRGGKKMKFDIGMDKVLNYEI